MKFAHGNTPRSSYNFAGIGEEEDPLELAIRSVEAEVAAQGWDQPPRLMVIWHRPDDDQVSLTGAISRTLVSSEALMFKEFYQDPFNGLRIWVNSFFTNQPKSTQHLKLLVDQDFYGWLLFTEARTHSEDEKQTRVRLGFLATKDGRLIQLRRTRNKKGVLDTIQVQEIDIAPMANTLAYWLMFLTAITCEEVNAQSTHD